MEGSMATARLTALAAVLVAMALAVAQPVPRVAGIGLLLGWAGTVFLAVGLVMGYRGGVVVAAMAFVLRAAVLGALGVELSPPLWAQTLLIVLMVELAGVSFAERHRPGDLWLQLGRGVAVALGAAAVVETLAVFLETASATGILVRVAGIAAAVIAIGWVTRVWRRSGLTG
jgi:hypothetical protein